MSDREAMPIGVLLAAGRSTRMGTSKMLLPWPPSTPDEPGAATRTVVEASFDAIAPACGAVVVVTGADPAATRRALGSRVWLETPGAPDGDMLESVRRGLAAASAARPAGPFVIHLADHPAVSPRTVKTLVAAAARHAALGRPMTVVPTHGGQGGHPAVVPSAMLGPIAEWTGPDGLAGLWRSRPELVVRLPVDDPGVRLDLDSPADYRAGASGIVGS